MLGDSTAMACFSTNDIEKAKEFYGGTLGIAVSMEEDDSLVLDFAGDTHVLVYLKEDHVPASHTVLLLSVADVEAEAADLKARGITLADLPYTDADGIARDESMPPTAWFQDPAGNWMVVGQLPS